MKTAIKKYWLMIALTIGCFGSFQAHSALASTIYVVEKSKSSPDMLTVHVTRQDKSSDTQLVLRGALMGIAGQVQNMTCNNNPIIESKSGIWRVPTGCQNLQWDVKLSQNGTELASSQQSVISGSFILFSEASSLPRLQDATSEIIKISIPNVKTIIPKPITQNEISLPGIHSAPFFVVLNSAIVGDELSNSIRLMYLLDNPDAISRLPSVSSHMMALEWLSEIIPFHSKQNFTIAWLGIPANKVSLAGAAGCDVLLANYPNDGEFPFGQAMLLYVALHEAFHQGLSNYSEQPTWVSESLASYYGIRALRIALPNGTSASALIEKFLAGADRYKNGLVTINRKVQEGDRSEYGAFYTKGIAFWMAVDDVLKQKQNDSLDNHLLFVLKAKYDIHGEPVDLQKILGIPSTDWKKLQQDFLG